MHSVVILGAGIAGLSAAWQLRQQGLQPLILERSSRAGGLILTERIGNFVIDAGADSILVQKPAALDLCHELGIIDRVMPVQPPRTAFVMRGGRLVPLPEGAFLGLPSRLWPLVSSRLFSVRGKLRIAAERVIPPNRNLDDESIGGFFRRRFGNEAREYLAEPLLAGIHAGDVDRLSIHSLFPRLVEAEHLHGSVLRGLASTLAKPSALGAFVSFPGGMIEIVDALVARLGDAAIRYNSSAVEATGTGPYTIRLDSGDEVRARALIVATPAWSAGRIVQQVDAELASLCARIPYVSSATVTFTLSREHVRHPLNGTGFVVPLSERERLLAATWVSAKWRCRAPKNQALLRAFLGGAHDPAILERSDAELADTAFAELAAVLRISGRPELTRVYRWPLASPQYLVGHRAIVRAIDDRLSHLPGLYVTGSGYRGVGIADCVADARATAARAATFVSGN